MKRPAGASVAICGLFILLFPGLHRRQRPSPTPELTQEYRHPSGAFSLRLPADWTVRDSPNVPDAVEIQGQDALIRAIARQGEAGYDSLHASCMMERLAEPMEMAPEVRYEYDFVDRRIGDRRALDSAFVVRYEKPIRGHLQWRQRNLTIVGSGRSLCIITYVPADLWKRSRPLQQLMENVLATLTLQP